MIIPVIVSIMPTNCNSERLHHRNYRPQRAECVIETGSCVHYSVCSCHGKITQYCVSQRWLCVTKTHVSFTSLRENQGLPGVEWGISPIISTAAFVSAIEKHFGELNGGCCKNTELVFFYATQNHIMYYVIVLIPSPCGESSITSYLILSSLPMA